MLLRNTWVVSSHNVLKWFLAIKGAELALLHFFVKRRKWNDWLFRLVFGCHTHHWKLKSPDYPRRSCVYSLLHPHLPRCEDTQQSGWKGTARIIRESMCGCFWPHVSQFCWLFLWACTSCRGHVSMFRDHVFNHPSTLMAVKGFLKGSLHADRMTHLCIFSEEMPENCIICLRTFQTIRQSLKKYYGIFLCWLRLWKIIL